MRSVRCNVLKVWSALGCINFDREIFVETEEDDGASKQAEEPVEVERIVKSPPEPTRVKSPEQMMVKSPEPVNWTVPLDTGKTFTVTQNIHDGKAGSKSAVGVLIRDR